MRLQVSLVLIAVERKIEARQVPAGKVVLAVGPRGAVHLFAVAGVG